MCQRAKLHVQFYYAQGSFKPEHAATVINRCKQLRQQVTSDVSGTMNIMLRILEIDGTIPRMEARELRCSRVRVQDSEPCEATLGHIES
jgi:hypothetical protein